MPLARSRAPFCCHVCHIICMSAQPEMVRVNAGSVVTRVADKQACGDSFTVMYFVGDTMGETVCARMRKITVTSGACLAVPHPTFVLVTPIYVLPKSGNYLVRK